jgi:hypothetical protein
MIDGQHDRPTRPRIENSGEPIFHPPIQGVRSFEEKSLRFLGDISTKLLCFLDFVCVRHFSSPFLEHFPYEILGQFTAETQYPFPPEEMFLLKAERDIYFLG